MLKSKDYFWKSPQLDVYRIGEMIGASNQYTLFKNGKPYFSSCEKADCVHALAVIKSIYKR